MIDNDMSTGTGGFGEILVSSRSLAEYQAMFALTDDDLDRRILDCPGGAAGFTAEVSRRGGDVTACDVAYFGDGLEQVAATAVAEADRGNRYVREHADAYSWTFFADPDAHHRARRESAEHFAAHARAAPDRYVAARLPTLPFPDHTFDLVLSSHLLFSYADDLDYAFHYRSIVELARVAITEVRLFPLTPIGSSKRYPRLEQLLADLSEVGIRSRIARVDYEFQDGADEMLVCPVPT
ncbi:methyltransferase domain-containing protein [Nocardia fluminea]|uniref:Methyltransferase family protein n=1 Tax=Nocardia fluminea TaxID=134984 RepID=A0A2N3VLN4_9NOCA|nr:methyltransferase domain-containing protein [Nocardia fluminea]PKV82514.1 methyltransferase family protein [Nocardia fluminea]